MADHLNPEILKARFVGITDPSGLQKRQLPVDIGDESELIIQFGDDNMLHAYLELTDLNPTFQKEYQAFEANIKILSQNELYKSLTCKLEEMLNLMSSTVSCVGCRRSVECIFQLVSEMNYHTLSPIKLHKHRDDSLYEFTLENDYLQSPKNLFMLLYVCKPNMEYLVNNIPKSRKNKRCNLHCLDSHKVKGVGMWMDFWRSLNNDCRDEIVTINIDAFVEALDSYLQKHRFCQECKGKVERAYKLLLKDVKPDENDQEYNEVAFSGIKVCKADRHLHIDSRDDVVSNLITRAEPELSNSSRRERHAKTMDVAQEEVLTCLGIVLHEKLHKLSQKVKAEEQTWLILVNTCLECLKRHLVLAIEEKRGYTNMDLFLLEHEEETKKKEMKKEIRREKKRKKKMAKKTGSDMNSTGGHSPSKDGFGLFADDDDDEEDDDDDDEEEEEFSKEAPRSSTKGLEAPGENVPSEGVVAPNEEEVSSDWQVVDNQCKQCNRQQRSRPVGNTASDLGSSRSHGNKGLSSLSNVINRHTNNNAHTSKSNSLSSGKKKLGSEVNARSPNVNSVSCCSGGGGGTGGVRSASKSERQLLSANHPRSSRCQPPQVPASSKRVSCTRLSAAAAAVAAKSPSESAVTTNGVASFASFSSSSSASSQLPQEHHSCGGTSSPNAQQPLEARREVVAELPSVDCSAFPQQHRGGRSRRSGAAISSPSSVGCCRVTAACSFPHSTRHCANTARKGDCEPSSFTHGPGPERRNRRCEEGASDSCYSTAKAGSSHHTFNHLVSEDTDNDEDFLTEQERVFYENNWQEIKEERERLRNKLRQAWSEKTKATG